MGNYLVINRLNYIIYILDDSAGNFGFVHGVDVDTADAVGNQVNYLVGGVGDSGLHHCFRGVAEAVADCEEFTGNIGVG